MNNTIIPQVDIDILRRLGARKRELSEHPANEERRRAWLALDSGAGDRVMVLAEHGGIVDERKPVPPLECADKNARNIERALRSQIYEFENLRDDRVITPWINVPWRISKGDFGVEIVTHHGEGAIMGSRRWDPPIRDLKQDFDKLKHRRFSVDRDATFAEMELMESVFRDILPVRFRGSYYWTTGLTWTAIDLIGLEGLMMAMYDAPEELHKLMAFLRDDMLSFTSWLQHEGLYSLDNENDCIGSGSIGYTDALPKTDWTPGMPVRRRDLWVLSESQETVGVGPEQFAEFVFPYQRDVVSEFGRCYYGCCEPLNNRWHVVKNLPNLSRVSVSPWADQTFMARALERDFVFSRKPNPSLISTEQFDEDAIRRDLRDTLSIAHGCRLEIIMKDVHTLHNEPDRLARWVSIACEEIARS